MKTTNFTRCVNYSQNIKLDMDFKEIFNKVSEKEKTEYLFQLLDKEDKLRQGFIDSISIDACTNSETTVDNDDFAGLVEGSYDEYLSEMESLNLEDTDWENYSPPHSGYIEDWEAEQHMAQQEADELFDYMKEHLVSLIITDDTETVVADLLAFYFASVEANINDPYDNLGDSANGYFMDMHKGFVDYAIEKTSIASIADRKLINTIKLFFNYFHTKKNDCFEDIKIFEGLLLALLNSIDDDENVKGLSNITKIDKKYFPQYSLQLEKRLGNEKSWLEHARKFYLIDQKVGHELLGYYYTEDINNYISAAKELFKDDKRYWAKEIAPDLKIEHDQVFYKDVYTELCISKRQISDYKEIKNILTETEKEGLHNELKWALIFRSEIYTVEKQFDKIKEIVEKNLDSYDFNKLIEPILNVYPVFCFMTIEKKANNAINSERGRGAYSRIASWLNISKKISGFQNKTKQLIMGLYNHKPNLPALKDEFRKAGLV